MCGIVGFIGQPVPLNERKNILQEMTNRLAHRGPDGWDVWCEETVGLGHRRLAIIDLKTGHQPMWNSAHEQIIVLNGEIYNYHELREELEKRGHRFLTSSDTEVIPATLQEWGIEKGLLRLRGMFAFALYNVKTHHMLLARDRTGIKPLYWTRKNNTIYFASEAKSLLLPGLAEHYIDPVSIHDFMRMGYAISPRTAWRDVSYLPPASWMEISPEGTKQGVYWQWTPRPNNDLTETQWLEQFEATFSDALRCHLLSDVPVGTFLSGGIDSSLIVALLSQHHSRNLNTYNVSFDEMEADEAPYARMVASQYKTNHHEVPISLSRADIDTFIKCVEQFDEPFGDTASLPNYLLSKATAQKVKVVLSGDGGDEALGGYRHYLRFKWLRDVNRLQWLNPLADPLLRIMASLNIPVTQKLLTAWEQARGDSVERLINIIALRSEEENASSYTAAFRELALAGGSTAQRIGQYLDRNIDNPLDQIFSFEMRLRLNCGYLRKTDITSSAHGLETRVPFLDNEMLEFTERLPSRFKVKGTQTKYLAYQLAKRYLPPEVANRPKHGFNFHLDTWSNTVEVQIFIKDLLFDPKARWRELLEEKYVQKTWEIFTLQGQYANVKRYDTYVDRIYYLTIMELWLQKWQASI